MEMLNRTRLAMVGAALLVVAVTVASPDAQAQRRCPAGESGCTMDNAYERMRDILQNGATDHFRSRSTYEFSNYGAARRSWRVGDKVRDCLNCGWDALKDSFDRFPTGTGGSVR